MTAPSSAPKFPEELPRRAALAHATALARCGACRNYHATWTYRRMIGAVGGVEADLPQLGPLLKAIGALPHTRRWLVVGAADAGPLAALCNSLGDARARRITVLDLCPTPLAVCAGYAADFGLDVMTVATDVSDFGAAEPYDAILVHSILGHLPASRRLPVLQRLAGWLRPGGHMALCSRLAAARPAETAQERRRRNLGALRAAVAAGTLTLPEPQAEFERRLALDAVDGPARDQLPATAGELADLVLQAGFSIAAAIDSGAAGEPRGWLSQRARHRVILHALASRQDPAIR